MVWLGFQLWVPLRARRVARRFGLGSDWARQASRTGRRRFVDPNDIALFRIDQDGDADRYLRRFEYAAISKRINPAVWRRDCALADKALFAARCAEFRLPSPPLLARIVDGRIIVGELPTSPALAIKPVGGLGGKGFALLDFAAWDQGADAFALFLAGLRDRSRGDWIVQPRIEGHPAIADLALDALSTARLTTMRDERGGLEIVTATFRFAGRAAAIVDNLAGGGLMAPIDIQTGRLGSACYGRRPESLECHPATGAAIAGRTLPNWTATRQLALDAHHRAFPEYSMVGWDVGIGRDGPLLIEGNGKPGLFAAQRAERCGGGETRFGSLIAYHLERTAEE